MGRMVMPEDAHSYETRFRPTRPASRPKLIAAIVIGPVLWVVALVVAAWLVKHRDAIEYALVVAAASFVVALLVLWLLRRARLREERRYAAGR
jgi:O-antigen/teichoic acid export membrane protein